MAIKYILIFLLSFPLHAGIKVAHGPFKQSAQKVVATLRVSKVVQAKTGYLIVLNDNSVWYTTSITPFDWMGLEKVTVWKKGQRYILYNVNQRESTYAIFRGYLKK